MDKKKDQLIAAKDQQILELMQRLQNLEDGGAAADAATANIQTELYRQQLSQASAELLEQHQQTAALEQQIVGLQRQITELQQQVAIAPIPQDLQQKEQQIAALHQQIAGLQSQVAQLQSQSTTAPTSEQLQQKDQQIAALHQQIAALQTQVADLQRHPPITPDPQKEQQIATLQQQVRDLQTQLEERTSPPSMALLQERDRQITALQSQLANLQAQPTSVSSELAPPAAAEPSTPPRDPMTPEQDSTLVSETSSTTAPPLDLDAVERRLKAQLGSTVWFCLEERSQHNLCRALLLHHQQTWLNDADYSEVGDRLCRVIEQEIVQPFFTNLYDFLVERDRPSDIGGISINPDNKMAFGFVASLIVPRWETFDPKALQASQEPNEEQLYATGRPAQLVGTDDRALMQQFLSGWEHPLATWLLEDPEDAASLIDQIHYLHQRIAQDNMPLYEWQYTLLSELVIGDDEQWGILQAVYRGRQTG
ncbi:MAG: hypothetical protein AAFY26_17995 [Cyanobacteria bacterium J06638_22]